jgi:hypothetical protein
MSSHHVSFLSERVTLLEQQLLKYVLYLSGESYLSSESYLSGECRDTLGEIKQLIREIKHSSPPPRWEKVREIASRVADETKLDEVWLYYSLI